MGPHTCCMPNKGCFMGKGSIFTQVCSQEDKDPIPCKTEGNLCGNNGEGVCGTEGVCCTEGVYVFTTNIFSIYSLRNEK